MSYFTLTEKDKVLFKDLPVVGKKALITRWALECDGLTDVLPATLINKETELTEDEWSVLIDKTQEHYNDRVFYYLEVPTSEVKSLILENLDDGDYNDWDEYVSYYGVDDIPDHSNENRWPCLSLSGDDEVFEDGWHRMHSYINNKHETIPVIVF